MNVASSFLVLSSARSRRVALASLISLAFGGVGCADVACFEWTTGEGACPSEEDALVFFEDPTCPGSGEIKSVESDGVFEDDACCYAVTKRDNSYPVGCFGGVPPGTSVTSGGPSGVTSTSGGGFGGAGGSSVTSGVGGAGGASPCVRCAEAISGGDTSSLCPSSQELFDLLAECMCKGVCAGVCAAECSSAVPAGMECQQCLTDSMMGCGAQFDACANDL